MTAAEMSACSPKGVGSFGMLMMSANTITVNAVQAIEEPASVIKPLAGMDEVAAILGVCRRTVIRLNLAGKLPKAIKVGRCVKWNCRELGAWVDHGCPPRGRWQPIWDTLRK